VLLFKVESDVLLQARPPGATGWRWNLLRQRRRRQFLRSRVAATTRLRWGFYDRRQGVGKEENHGNRVGVREEDSGALGAERRGDGCWRWRWRLVLVAGGHITLMNRGTEENGSEGLTSWGHLRVISHLL
jgi:hypothetical protein